ncbi:MAG: F0F1 ATP synthase subunit delta [Ruthenibacterium lactatiformans]
MTAAEKEYGGALYALAAEEHCEDAVLEGLTLAADAFRETPGYLKLVQNPAVPREERLAMLDEAFGAGVRLCAEFFEDTVREIRTRYGCGLPAGV